MHFRPENIVPFEAWLRHYNSGHLRADIFAGLTVAVVALPQSMAYALIAGLPVQYGLYASIVPAIIGSLWGSSAHLITGPTTAVSLVVFSTLSDLAPPGSGAYIGLAFFLALMIGGIQIAMGVARLGNLLNFVSHAVLLGFTAGAAVLIAFKQLPGLLGIPVDKGDAFLVSLFELLPSIRQTVELLWVRAPDASAEDRSQAADGLRQARQWLTNCGHSSRTTQLEDRHPANAIAQAAGADALVVIGASLRHDVYRLTRGSLPIRLLSRTRASVLLVKTPPEADPGSAKAQFDC